MECGCLELELEKITPDELQEQGLSSGREIFFPSLCIGLCAYFAIAIFQNLQTERNDVSKISDPDVVPISLSIAVIGDTHLPEGHERRVPRAST